MNKPRLELGVCLLILAVGAGIVLPPLIPRMVLPKALPKSPPISTLKGPVRVERAVGFSDGGSVGIEAMGADRERRTIFIHGSGLRQTDLPEEGTVVLDKFSFGDAVYSPRELKIRSEEETRVLALLKTATVPKPSRENRTANWVKEGIRLLENRRKHGAEK